MRARISFGWLLSLALAVGCEGGPAPEDPGAEVDADPACDPLVPTACALPWPSSLYLEEDPSRATGYTLAFAETTLPANTEGTHVSPEHYRRLDGYALGTSLLAHFPGLDAELLPNELELERTLSDDSPVVLLEAGEGGARRVPCWAELDARAADPDEAVLFVRPAELLRPATRYVVAFRDLLDLEGEPIQPSPAFRLLRDGRAGDVPVLAPRVARFETLFADLEAAGLERGSLQLAWDFVTASEEALHGDMLAIRERAFELVGEQGPELAIERVEEYLREDDGSGAPVDELVRYRVFGTFRVPQLMVRDSIDGLSGGLINRDADGVPSPDGWVERGFVAMIPHDDGQGRRLELMQYGHGLLGAHDQVFGGYNAQVAYDHQVIYFGCTLTGFGAGDVSTVMWGISEMTKMVWFAETIHQGLMEYLLLARGVRERFAALPEIAALGLDIDSSVLHYSGISQGGIYGATVMALSQDITRGHLGVPGQNYNLLLERSVDFSEYFGYIGMTYPRRFDQPILLEAVALLWGKTDPVAYYRHISAEPFPDTPAHAVLLAQAVGDYQVATITNEIVVRSGVGVALMEGYGRDVPLAEPVAYPREGSALVSYSFGDDFAPPGNLPPEETDRGDPHGKPRRQAHHNEQMMHFLRTGEVIDVCGGDGCAPE